MSTLSSVHSPKMGMSGSFGSKHCMTPTEANNLRKKYSFPGGKNSTENTPFIPPPSFPTTDLEKGNPPSKNNGEEAQLTPTLLTTIIVVTIGSSLQFGYGTGVMNNAEDVIMPYYLDQGKDYTIVQWGVTVSCYGIGGLIGSLLGPKVIGAYCGRRATLLVNNIFLVISSILIAFAPQWYYQAIGRIFVGIVAGVATR